MKNQFDTEKEAQESLETARSKNLGYCPLIMGDCRKRCICYYEGAIRQGTAPGRFWFVHYPCCINLLMSDVVTVES